MEEEMTQYQQRIQNQMTNITDSIKSRPAGNNFIISTLNDEVVNVNGINRIEEVFSESSQTSKGELLRENS